MKSIETRGIIKKHNKTSARVLLPKAFQVLEGVEATITVLVTDEQFEEYSKATDNNSRK
ncbi:hypothetical protein [Methanococcus maripaludis]|jgi:hypothetical protein|uniref:Uncharacterized protein n=1 Tax=Methanococcus maripaludis TaxID=39152 RepID=A0A8T3W7W8_METMI|nr:hypothetical protein [Methanococcus maripaludis]MBG0769672.1 hypothetical protein [Methanococcus maripaludis]